MSEKAEMLMSHTMHLPYLGIAHKAVRNMLPIRQKLETLIVQKGIQNEDPKIVAQDFYEMHQHAATAIVFSALAVEGYINHYILSNTSESQFNKYFERLDVKQKFLFAPKLLKNIDIDPGRHEFGCLDELIKWRNELVHFKGKVRMNHTDLAKELAPLPVKAEKAKEYALEIIMMMGDVDKSSVALVFGL